eukprot:gene4673-5120_t
MLESVDTSSGVALSQVELPSSGRILCCLCGLSIVPNAAAMCLQCLTTQFDITAGIPTDGEIVFCKKCERWQVGADHWVHHELESSGLLAACMKKISAFNSHDNKIVNASWIWTEAHSKRLKFLVEIEKDVLDGKMALRQKVIVDFVVKNKQCLDCIHEASEHTWGACLQVRQHGAKKTFHALEAQLTKAQLFHLMIDVRVVKDGLDLFFRNKNQADKVQDYLVSHLPVRCKASKKLVSRDLQSNVSRYEYTTTIEIVPLNRGDLIITSKALVGHRDLFLVTKISSLIHLLQPLTLQRVEVSAAKYFSITATLPLVVVARERQLRPYVVLDISPLSQLHAAGSPGSIQAKESGGVLADAIVAREEDLGSNDEQYTLRTHLGHLLQAGDYALGYDLVHCAHGLQQDAAIEGLSIDLPDVVLVRKHFAPQEAEASAPGQKGVKTGRKKNRIPPWRLKEKTGVVEQVNVEGERATEDAEEEEEEEVEWEDTSETSDDEMDGEDDDEGLLYADDLEGLEEVADDEVLDSSEQQTKTN